MKKDQIYAGPFEESATDPLEKVRAFAFDEKVVPVFQDMISRSVPGYETMLRAIGVFAMRYAQPQTRLYDLGTSLGAVAYVLACASEGRNCQVVAVDNSRPMIESCRQRLQQQGVAEQVDLRHEDLENTAIEKASVVVSNFTLQFIAREKRDALVQRIHDGLVPGGVFVLSEKIRVAEEADNAFLIDHYHGYKKINGYSDEEIARKRQALEKVLQPDSLQDWHKRLKQAGFAEVHQWFQCFNFVSLIAFKGGQSTPSSNPATSA